MRCENPASFSKIVAFMAQGNVSSYIQCSCSLFFVDVVELGDFDPSTSLSLLMLPNLNVQLLSQITELYSQLE